MVKKIKKPSVAKPVKKSASKKKSAVEKEHKETARRKECPDCGSTNILYESTTEQLICHDCGLIFEELLPEVEEEYDRVDAR